MNWVNTDTLPSKDYKCGYCSASIASQKGYYATVHGNPHQFLGYIYICHKCLEPTYFNLRDNIQTPGPIIGNPVKHIPRPEVEELFDEAKSCFSIGAYTASVMSCRKLLMNLSVSEGAEEGKSYADYVNYLNDNNYIPPGGKIWVDSIRKLGNEANHEIAFKTSEDAERILNFTEMLLRFIYEMPGIMEEPEQPNENGE